MLRRVCSSSVLAGVLLILVASGVCWAVTVNVNPHKIVLNAKGASDDVQANISIYLPGAPVEDFNVTLSFDENEDGVVDDGEVIAEAKSAFYCVLDDILIVGFDRTALQETLKDRELVNTIVELTVEGTVTVTNANGDETTVPFSGAPLRK